MSNKPYNILFLFPGPNYALAHDYGYRMRALSAEFRGIVYTVTPFAGCEQHDGFEFRTIGVPKGRDAASSPAFLLGAVGLARELRRDGVTVDLVISYDPLKAGLAGWLMAKILGCPLLCEVNGDYADPDNYADIRDARIAFIKRHIYVKLARFVLGKAAAIRLLYPEQIDYCRDAVKAEVISLFDYCDLRAFKPGPGKLRILLAGFPFRRKGVDLLIAAFKQVAGEFPAWDLRILGHYPDKEPLERHIAGHPRIHHHKPVMRSQMPEQVSEASIVVLPSRSEAMGRILLEAKACAKPAIGARVGGIPYVINDKEDGLLFAKEDVAGLAQCLRQLMSDVLLRESMGQQARHRLDFEFASERYFRVISEFYRRTIETERSRRKLVR